jgi:NarL family two-component system sensor histidine kinase LiaS
VLVVFVALPTTWQVVGNMAELFGVSLACFTPPVAIMGALFGSLTARGLVRRLGKLSAATRAWSQGDFSFFEDTSRDELGQLARQMNRMAEQLQNLLHARQQIATLEERNRLARDLHDSVKQQAFGVATQIWTARTLLEHDPEAAGAHLAEAGQLADNLRQELTGLIRELRPVPLEQGLADALREYAADWSHRNGIEARVQAPEEHPLSPEVEQGLLRIAQEALANVARHSDARNVELVLTRRAGQVELVMADDGRGFDPDGAHGGFGLRSMRERAELLGGGLSVESRPGAGTRIACTVPAGLGAEEAEEVPRG